MRQVKKRRCKMDRQDFESMVEDWIADHAACGELVVDEIRLDDTGKYIALVHDDNCTYQLNDDGTGNIEINYLNTK
jgi:hypothetical protein